MDIEVTVSNYRCFSDKPVRFALKNGLQSFVGVNNSGKSCLLRLFYELRNVFNAMSSPQGVQQSITGTQNYQPMPMVKDPEEIFCDRNDRELTVGFDLAGILPSDHPNRFEISISKPRYSCAVRVYANGSLVAPQAGIMFSQRGPEVFVSRQPNGQVIASLSPIVEICKTLGRMLYIGPFRNAVNVGGTGHYYDIQIGQPFIANWKTLKTGYVKRSNEAANRLTEDIRRIFGLTSLEINATDDSQDIQLMVDGKPYKQSEIGSGLIQFILVLVNAAIKQPSYILIDEPELNLHPSLQIDFLTTLASYAECGVLFATHNLGLARAVSDRVYSVRRIAHNDREVRDFTGTKALAEFLGELGFNAYQDLGFETVLLVEGPTDVTCVQQFLRLYQKEHEVVMLQLGGSSTINSGCEAQLAEVTRISPRVRALIDSERSQSGEPLAQDRQGFVDACSRLKIPCCVLERRAIENYLSEHAIKTLKNSDKYRALGHYEALKTLNPAWGKEENWKIARLMTRHDLDGTDLGRFLADL